MSSIGVLLRSGIWLAGFFAVTLHAEVCSLRVNVRTSDGTPLTIPVEVRTGDGKLLVAVRAETGLAAFCDLPLGVHTVVVDPGRCGEITVKNVYVGYRTERTIDVIANGCPHWMLPPILSRGGRFKSLSCRALLRVRIENGAPVSGAKGVLSSKEGIITAPSDNYGRLWVGGVQNELDITVHAPGLVSQQVAIRCSVEQSEVEDLVVLKKAPAIECNLKLRRECYALVRVGHRTWTGEITGFQLSNLKSRIQEQFLYGPVEMASACDVLPYRCQPVLPHGHFEIWSTTMLDKNQTAARFQYAPHFIERLCGVRDGTEGPCDHSVVNARRVERKRLLGWLAEKLHFYRTALGSLPGNSLKLS